jgi:hypothetical protein
MAGAIAALLCTEVVQLWGRSKAVKLAADEARRRIATGEWPSIEDGDCEHSQVHAAGGDLDSHDEHDELSS